MLLYLSFLSLSCCQKAMEDFDAQKNRGGHLHHREKGIVISLGIAAMRYRTSLSAEREADI